MAKIDDEKFVKAGGGGHVVPLKVSAQSRGNLTVDVELSAEKKCEECGWIMSTAEKHDICRKCRTDWRPDRRMLIKPQDWFSWEGAD